MTYLEESLARDVARLTGKLAIMAGLAERALTESLAALTERNCQKAYSVILRDQRIDELEKEIDRLCLEFFVRQQPVAKTLRFAYAVMRINAELERVGDYAESMARQTLLLCPLETDIPTERFAEIAQHAIPMLHAAVEAFTKEDAALARKTMEREETVDRLRHQLSAEMVRLSTEGKLPVVALSPLFSIVNRFERVADQAKNICQQVLYFCTGQYLKHPGSEVTRLLFVDEHNSCRSQMAEVAACSLRQPRFVFWSAGIDRRPIDQGTVDYLSSKGMDISGQSSKLVEQVPNLDHFQVIVALDPAARRAFPPPPTKVVCIDWSLPDPSLVKGSAEERAAAYEEAYQFLISHVRDLVEAIVTDQNNSGGETP